MKRVVLMVTEDLELLSSISQRFNPENYRIQCAAQEQAIEGVVRFAPNLVLWDSAPLPSDYGFVEALRSQSQIGWLPVVLLSKSNEFKNRLKALKSGVDVYLGRPFELEEVFAIIEALLAQGDRFRPYSTQTRTSTTGYRSSYLRPQRSDAERETSAVVRRPGTTQQRNCPPAQSEPAHSREPHQQHAQQDRP